MLLRALYNIIDKELVVKHGEPPPECKEHFVAVLEQTLLRRIKLIRARQSYASSSLEDDIDSISADALTSSLPALRSMVNGDVRRSRPEHYCRVRCVDEHGVSTREACVKNFYSALVSTGIWRGLNHIVPAKSRWLSTSLCLSNIAAGLLMHGLFARSWLLAFGDWHVEAPDDVAAGDFHTITRSKAYRAKLWLSQSQAVVK